MSTTNTDNQWNWYVRQKGRHYYLGIVDEDGAASTSALTVDIWYIKFPSDVSNADAILPIPEEYIQGFIKGVVYEYLLMNSPNISDRRLNLYAGEYERTVRMARRHIAIETASTGRIKPLDLRMD